MLTTGCEGCCFLKANKQCAIGQFNIDLNGKMVAPGYCRCCRSISWAKDKGLTETEAMIQAIIADNKLVFDLIVIFDEHRDTIKDLETTIGNSSWYKNYAKKVIIADTTGFGDRKNLAMQYLQNNKQTPIEIVANSSVDHEPPLQTEQTIRRIVKMVKSPFFFVIRAGSIVRNIDELAVRVQQIPARVIHWSVPYMTHQTFLHENFIHSGLFITVPYRTLMANKVSDTFTNVLEEESKTTHIKLSWLCEGSCISRCKTTK